MLKAAITWLVAFSISVMVARGEAWRTAFQLTMAFPSYDDEAIYRQIKDRVFTKAWLFSALTGSTLVATAMLVSNEALMVVLIVTGVALVLTVCAMQGYRLFRIALTELGLAWPPSP